MRPIAMAGVLLAAMVCGAAAQQAGPVRVGRKIQPPARIKTVPPEYPDEAIKARVHGAVVVELTVSAKGDVESARIVRSIPKLDQAALDAVRQWQYTPTKVRGVAVPVIMTVTVNFTLQADLDEPAPARPPMASAADDATSRLLTDEEARRDPFLLALGRAGIFQLGMPMDLVFHRVPVVQTNLVDLREEGEITPAVEIRLEPGARQPAMRALFRSVGPTWAVFALEVTDPRFRTADGLGVGSTLAQIRAVAPAVQPVAGEGGVAVPLRDRAMFFWLDAPAGTAPAAVPDTAVVTRVALRAAIPRDRH